MTVQKYLFQSPYSSSVQIGRPDPNAKSEDTDSIAQNSSANFTNQTLQDSQNFQASQVSEVKPTVDSKQLLDVYA